MQLPEPYAAMLSGRKKQILDEATAVFAAEGYDGASIARIAERVGISQPGLLHHFPTKETLLVAVLAYRDLQDAQALNIDVNAAAIMEMQFPIGGIELLKQVEALFRRGQQRPQIIRLFAKMGADGTSETHPAHEWATTRYAIAYQTYADAFARDQAAGRLRPDIQPEFVARELIAMMDGLQLQFLLGVGDIDAGDVFANYLTGLIDRISV